MSEKQDSKKTTKKISKRKEHLTLEMIELNDFRDIDWIKYKDDVENMKDILIEIYGKGFYKAVIRKIEGKQNLWDRILGR